MNKQKLGFFLFGTGVLYAVLFAVFGTWPLLQTLRTVTFSELRNTIWALDQPLFMVWAFSVPLGALLGIVGALIYFGIKKFYILMIGFGYLVVVFLMTFIFGKVYYPPLFGIGGCLILLFFFLTVWHWIKNFQALDNSEKMAAIFQLIGYLFFITAAWFLCGDLASLRLKAFETRHPPFPTENMVYLVLGWFFIFLSHYKSRRATS